MVVNEAAAGGRVTGTDLLAALARAAPLDLFGMDAAGGLGGHRATCRRTRCTTELARRRVYVHPIRWTSLGLSLLEAMHLGMPVVALATTEVPEAVPPEAGVVSTRPDVLADARSGAARRPEEARGARQGGARRRRWSATGWTGSWPTGTRSSRR